MKKIPFLKEGCVFKQVDDTTKGTEFKGAKIPLIEDGCIVRAMMIPKKVYDKSYRHEAGNRK